MEEDDVVGICLQAMTSEDTEDLVSVVVISQERGLARVL
jgi:hypothetical protein